MPKQKIKISKVLEPSDSFAIAGITIGLLIALFLPQLEIRLIGIALAVLSSLGLFINLSKRLKDYVGSKYTPSSPQPDLTITIKNEQNAKRQVIEDFEKIIETEIPNKTIKKSSKIEETKTSFAKSVINKFQNLKETTESQKIEQVDSSLEFNEGDSGVRIIRKTSKATPVIQTEDEAIPSKAINTKYQAEYTLENQSITEEEADIKKPEIINDRENISEIKPDQIKEEYIEYKQVQKEKTADKHLFVSKSIEIPESYYRDELISDLNQSNKEIESSLQQILKIIRLVTSTKTTIFFLVDLRNFELIPMSYISDTPEAVLYNAKIPIQNDVVSQIVINMKPEILSEINPAAELDLIPYYKSKTGTSSFIGVPVIHNESIIGVLCADTKHSDAYDTITASFFGHFTRLIASILDSYTQKYEMNQSTKALESIKSFRKKISKHNLSIEDISNSIINTVSNFFNYVNIGLCVFENNTSTWKIKDFRSKSKNMNNIINKSINLENSLIGKTISTAETQYYTDIPRNTVRIHPDESNISECVLVTVPLKSLTYNYGALFIEGDRTCDITTHDLNLLEALCDNAGTHIEQIYYLQMMQESSYVDITTGLLYPSAFYQRIDEEFLKAKEFGTFLTLCLFNIDNYDAFGSLFYNDSTEQAINQVLQIVKKYIKSYYVFGKADSNIFGIGLIGFNLQDAKLWGERLRSDIARTIIEIENKRFNVTLSVGLADNSICKNYQDLVSFSKKALDKSKKKTNSVTVYA